MLIRTATAADWPAIWPFFRAIVDEGDTYAYPEDLTSEEARVLWMAAPAPPGRQVPPTRTVVALDEHGGRLLGSATMGPNRPGRGSHVATASFMVDPAASGRGVGRALGQHALRWARENRYRSMQFNAVVETNAAAVHLWQSLGFRILATVPEAFQHPRDGLVGLHVMYQPL